MIKNLTKQKIAIATAMTLALITAQAQTADGTVVISGQVNANTCKVNISDASGVSPTNNGVRSVELGTVSPTGTFTAGQLLGTKQIITFSLTASSGTRACTFTGGTTGWNMALDLQSNQVNSTIANKPFLTNLNGTNPSTNIGVALFDNSGNQFSTLLTGQGFLGTKLAAAATGVLSTANLTMGAQFMATSATAPTAGLFQTTVPMLIVYN
jgi:type 1 fimbria pilin